MAWDALRLRNTIQLGGILIFHAGLIVSASLQAYETGNAFHDVTDGSLCSTIVSNRACNIIIRAQQICYHRVAKTSGTK